MSSIPLECFICYKNFSGPESAGQHFNSTEHGRKAEFKPSHSGMSCSVCRINCDTRKILQEHLTSPRHLATVEKQQMFESTRHHPGMVAHRDLSHNIQLREGPEGSEASIHSGQCQLCNVKYTSHKHATDHLKGKNHNKKLVQYEMMQKSSISKQSYQTGFQSAALNVADINTTNLKQVYNDDVHAMNRRLELSRGTPQHANVDLSPSRCDICDVILSGPTNVEQHYNGEKHRKNLELKKKVNMPGVPDQFKCDLCKVTFTGPESERDHMASDKHKKKALLAQKQARGEDYPLHCNACDAKFTGQESAAQHFDGAKHKRTVENEGIKAKKENFNDADAPLQFLRKTSDLNFVQRNDTVQSSPTDHKLLCNNISDERLVHNKPIGIHQNTKNDKPEQRDEILKQPDFVDSDAKIETLRLDDDVDKNESNTTDNVTFVHNQLHSPTGFVSIGRGRGVFSLLNELKSSAIPKVNNTSLTNESLKTSIHEKADSDNEKEVITNYRTNVPDSMGTSAYSKLVASQSLSAASQLPSAKPQPQLTASQSPFAVSQSPFAASQSPFAVSQSPFAASQSPFAASQSPFAVSQSPFAVSQSPFAVSQSPFAVSQSPFAVSQSPFAVSQSPFAVSQSPFAVSQSVLHASNPPTAASNLQLAEGVVNQYQQRAPLKKRINERRDSSNEYVFNPSTGRGICFVCNIDLTSLAHKNQHLSGQKHKKALAVKEQFKNTGLQDSPFVCKICSVTFTGFEAREQHMNSERHLAKEKGLLIGTNEYFCDVCKVACTGPESYSQHLAGSQHAKMSGAGTQYGNGAMNFDLTNWHHCEICKCNLNSREQLMIHKKSPKHLKQLEKMAGMGSAPVNRIGKFECKVCSCFLDTRVQLQIHEASPKHLAKLQKSSNIVVNPLGLDRTTWHHCDVCNCNLNTAEQLAIHKSSPAHLAKAAKSSGHIPDAHVYMDQDFTPAFTNQASNAMSSMAATPLEVFLSEPLFPEHLMSNIEDSADSPENNNTAGLEFTELLHDNFADAGAGKNEDLANSNNGAGLGAGNSEGLGGNVKNYSDITWATRSRGSRENRSSERKTSSERSQHNDLDIQRGRSRSTELNPMVNNPHAATHPYYCHTCKAPMNTRQAYEIHLKGKRHMQKISVDPAPVREHKPPESGQYPPCTRTKPRAYQFELFGKAMVNDTLCFLPTGTGKTLVSIMAMSAMLNKYPTKNVLFLVDKVLLVLQQTKQIRKEIGDTQFLRYNPDSATCLDIESRDLYIASVCMGQQNTYGIPLWKHDVVVVTADFCRNLLDKEILRWTDFSLVVFDEAHHCDKGHPFNTLLTNYHQQVTNLEDRPKILGLTASPAGKSDIPKTYQMLARLVDNMGNVEMSVVEEPVNVDVLREYQSNAEMIIRSPSGQNDNSVKKLLHEFNIYIMHCVIKLLIVSNIDYYVSCRNEIHTDMTDADINRIADEFLNRNIDLILSSLMSLQQSTDALDKVQFSLFISHVQSICLARSSLMEGGELCVRQEFEDLQSTDSNFTFAKSLGLPVDNLVQVLGWDYNDIDDMFASITDVDDSLDVNIKCLIDELTKFKRTTERSISLVLVKQRSSAVLITRVLQNSLKMRNLGLNTTYVIGHGGSGSNDKGMTVNQQKRILDDIKQFKYQVVIATSVAEEGVDWPDCDCVISMYPPTTVTALIQMRGRARKKGSKFIILCGSMEEEGKLYDIMQREANMIDATRMLIKEKRKL
ncbi:hypothetical protein ACF0H5_015183 [Mactra antiquata]